MATKSPTAWTLEWFEKNGEGSTVEVIERYIPGWTNDPVESLEEILDNHEGVELTRSAMAAILDEYKMLQRPGFGHRKDWGGFGDLLGATRSGIYLIQCCTLGGNAIHIRKIINECADPARAWIRAGGLIQVWAWRRLETKKEGSLRKWWAKVTSITLEEERLVPTVLGDF